CVRDVDDMGKMPIGVQALGAIPRKSNRKGVGDADIEISFGGLTINSGMYVYADNNGMIVSTTSLL
ncbi:putative 4-hydroxy-4-methyl-2-oxoglutarate aldolase, partial [Pseudoduganella danionis]|uniref:RraA family protein n=1 Tax=Pseudoduganella danionis TaxID=1890295 RepID=UPI0035E52595